MGKIKNNKANTNIEWYDTKVDDETLFGAKCTKHSKEAIDFIKEYLYDSYYQPYYFNDVNVLTFDMIKCQFVSFNLDNLIAQRKQAVRRILNNDKVKTNEVKKEKLKAELLAYLRDNYNIKKAQGKVK